MHTFEELKQKAYELVSEEENYIIVLNGKLIDEHIKLEDSVDISVDSKFDPIDLIGISHSETEENIIQNSNINSFFDIYKDINLKIVYLNDKKENLSLSFEIERNLNVKITNLFISFTDVNTNIVLDYNLNDNSKVNVVNFTNFETSVNLFNNYYLDEKASIDIDNLHIDDTNVEIKNKLYLYNKRANANVNNCIINSSSKEEKYNTVINHFAPYTVSKLIGYGVCKNNSKLNMDTNGYIKNGCKQSEVYQKSKGIILDLDSTISASPWLQIDEFDVQASHGASIGAIDESDLFYLMSRGLDKETSESLIINGFFNPFLSKITDDKLLNYFKNIIEKHMK